MRVAILGGWDEDAARNKDWGVAADRRSQAQIIKACRAIGERLARNKHSVIVGSEKKNSADYHVVHAMLGQLKAPNGPLPWIEVVEGVESKEPLYKRERTKYPSFFSPINRITGERAIRSAEKIMAVQKADVVITVGD